MRTNIEIDDRLMKDAMKASRLPTKRAVVEEGLRLVLRRHKRQRFLDLYGTVDWQGRAEENAEAEARER